ncbi:MAG: hypothetical protein ACOY4I_15290 [Bacillota bacterium]
MGSRRDRINNEKARRREAKVYNENLQKEVAALLKLFHNQHQQMSIALRKDLAAYEKARVQAAREDARQRAIYEKNRVQAAREDARQRAIYEKNRVLEVHEFMNEVRKYLLDLLDLDFGVKSDCA